MFLSLPLLFLVDPRVIYLYGTEGEGRGRISTSRLKDNKYHC